jgi:hypothetical protein
MALALATLLGVTSKTWSQPNEAQKLQFGDSAKVTDKLQRQFSDKELKLEITGSNWFLGHNEFYVHLVLEFDVKDSSSLDFNAKRAKVFCDGQRMKKRLDRGGILYLSSSKAEVGILFYSNLDFDKIWDSTGAADGFSPPDISIVLDSAIMWQNHPLDMDPIEPHLIPRRRP